MHSLRSVLKWESEWVRQTRLSALLNISCLLLCISVSEFSLFFVSCSSFILFSLSYSFYLVLRYHSYLLFSCLCLCLFPLILFLSFLIFLIIFPPPPPFLPTRISGINYIERKEIEGKFTSESKNANFLINQTQN